MDIKKSMAFVAMGVGGTLLYQQVKNGNAKKYVGEVNKFAKKTMNDMSNMYDDLEDMM